MDKVFNTLMIKINKGWKGLSCLGAGMVNFIVCPLLPAGFNFPTDMSFDTEKRHCKLSCMFLDVLSK